MNPDPYGGLLGQSTANSDPYGGLLEYHPTIKQPSTQTPAQVPSGPVSIDQTAQQDVGKSTGESFWNDLKNFGSNAVSDAGTTASSLGKILLQAPIGAVEDISNTEFGTGFDTPQMHLANAIPGAVAQIPGQLYNFGKEVVQNPQQALSDTGNFVYQHPVQSLLNVSGLGDIAGAGVDLAGDITGNAALNAAGETLKNASSAINPVNQAVNLTGKAISGAGKLGSAIGSNTLGFTTGQGADAIRAIASPEGYAAMKSGVSPDDILNTTKQAVQDLKDARSTQYESDTQKLLDSVVAQNPDISPFDKEVMQPQIAESAVNTLSNKYHMSIASLAPEDVQFMRNYAQNIISGDNTAIGATPTSPGAFAAGTKYQDLIDQLGIKTPVKAPETGSLISSTRGTTKISPFLGTSTGETGLAQNVLNYLDNQYHPVITDYGDITDPAMQSQVKRAVNTIFSHDDYSPQGINNLRKTIAPLSKGNPAVYDLKNVVTEPLTQFPEFQKMQQNYAQSSKALNEIESATHISGDASSASKLNAILRATKTNNPYIEKAMNDLEESSPGLKAKIGAYGMSEWAPNGKLLLPEVAGAALLHSPSALLSVLASSPRLIGELVGGVSHILQKPAEVAGNVGSAIADSPLGNSTVQSILNIIGGKL